VNWWVLVAGFVGGAAGSLSRDAVGWWQTRRQMRMLKARFLEAHARADRWSHLVPLWDPSVMTQRDCASKDVPPAPGSKLYPPVTIDGE
jgi:hypothetical protein